MQYSLDVNKMLRGMLLAILTFFVIHLVKSGDINLLVSPIIAKIVNFSVIPFIILTLATLKYSFVRQVHDHQHHDHEHHQPHHYRYLHEHTENCECGHNHAKPKSLWAQATIGLLFVSLTLAYSWHPKAIGTDMIAQAKTQNPQVKTNKVTNGSNSSSSSIGSNGAGTNTNTNTNSSSDHSAYAPGIINVNEDTVGIVKQTSGDSEASVAMRYGANPKSYWGKKVDLDGFVYHPNGLPANHFVLTRFFIFCCVADASPIGITVNSTEANQLKNDTWVHISGVIQPTPDKPYMIPNSYRA